MESQEIKDTQALLNIFFPFGEELLVRYGEFYPFAGATTIDGSFVSVGDGAKQETRDSALAIADLKQTLKQGSEVYLVIAIFYEVKIKDHETGQTSDAIAVFVEHRNGESAYEFIYNYKLENKENFIMEDSYGETIPKEIFLPPA